MPNGAIYNIYIMPNAAIYYISFIYIHKNQQTKNREDQKETRPKRGKTKKRHDPIDFF